ncbi:alpha/beta hydrolase [Compostibacter hankyongensis]|uniref:Alpha/beta hydrolase n=1 Tax=Compostibacter hankyongensis TaxID=1007089 RepID=A0ABP8FR18_9BACT
MQRIFLFALILFCAMPAFAQNASVIHLWPGKVPGEKDAKHPAEIAPDSSRGVTRLTNVTNPTLTVYEPDAGHRNGAGIIVCPGGGYSILAIDLEGDEVAKWLNTLGFTAFVLQYRVPQKQEGALQDVQRAIRIVRKNAAKWSLNPDKVGVLGFSAGGDLSARASTLYDQKTYPAVDDADAVSCRPDFAVLIYPAYLDKGPEHSITPGVKVNEHTPPMFLFSTADDPHGLSALAMASALKQAKVPVEQHLYPKGGHGYGLRPGNPAAMTWPTLAGDWLEKTVAAGK